MVVARAIADLAALDAERNQLQARLNDINDKAGRLRVYISVAREYGGVNSPVDTDRRAPDMQVRDVRHSTRGITGTAVEAVIKLISERGGPIHTRELIKLLAALDIHINGANPVVNLSGFLSREKERLRNSRIDGWSLRGWDSSKPNERVTDDEALIADDHANSSTH